MGEGGGFGRRFEWDRETERIRTIKEDLRAVVPVVRYGTLFRFQGCEAHA